MFVCRLGARRQMGLMMRTAASAQTFDSLFGVARVAHGDTVDGFAFSIMSEFIENPKPDCSKQDCELKAFYRLAHGAISPSNTTR